MATVGFGVGAPTMVLLATPGCSSEQRDFGPTNSSDAATAEVEDASDPPPGAFEAGATGNSGSSNAASSALAPSTDSGTTLRSSDDGHSATTLDGDAGVTLTESDAYPEDTGNSTASVSSSTDGSSNPSGAAELPDSGSGTSVESDTAATTSDMAATTSDSETATEPVDSTAPVVLSTSPVSNASGVADDAVITIRFSEAMDQVATQAAFQSANLGAFTLDWNAEATELRIASAGLTYASGGPDVQANVYTYRVTTVAKDRAGNPMASPYDGRFETLRRVNASLDSEAALWLGHGYAPINASGQTDPCDVYQDEAIAFIGWANATWCRVVVGYSLQSVPADAQLEAAELSCAYNSYSGSPWGYGNIELNHVRYNAMNLAEAFSITPLQSLGGIFSSSKSTASVDVSDSVGNDLSDGRSATQFRFQFASEPEQSSSSAAAYVRFYSDTGVDEGGCSRLSVTYLTP